MAEGPGGVQRARWDPRVYGEFGTERAQPFFDLLAAVDSASPRRVVDLGCGPGSLTAVLAERWPDARVIGLDSSEEMLAAAAPLAEAHPNLSFEIGDIAGWSPDPADDVVLTNAALQWVPDHRELLPEWFGALAPGAVFAMQVPGNFGAPSHRLMRKLAESPRWRSPLSGVLRHDDAVGEPVDYLRAMRHAGLRARVWETTYLHVLQGEDPVLEWVRGTGLRPALAALGDRAPEFEEEYAALLRHAYPSEDLGTPYPFRRIFAVGVREQDS